MVHSKEIAVRGGARPAAPSWPGSVFDIVFVFTRRVEGWNFAQVRQVLLAGDSTKPIS